VPVEPEASTSRRTGYWSMVRGIQTHRYRYTTTHPECFPYTTLNVDIIIPILDSDPEKLFLNFNFLAYYLHMASDFIGC
jgi:hypothetical protein